MDEIVKVLYRAARDKVVAVCVLAAGIGLLIAFRVLYALFCRVEAIAIICGIPATLVGIVSLIAASRYERKVKISSGITWGDLICQNAAASSRRGADS